MVEAPSSGVDRDQKSIYRSVWLAVLITAAVVLPRTRLISRAHSTYWDDQYHLIRGLEFLRGGRDDIELRYNDPPLGEALLALPMWVMGGKPLAGEPEANPRE